MPVKRTGGLAAKLAKVNDEARRQISTAVYAVADQVASDAAHSIVEGSVSGKNHQPSPAGSPPSNDTGVLMRSIHVERVDDLTARVVADAPYAAIQELGGTINHPGGTPYFMRDGKPVFVSKQGAGAFQGLPVTKPHTITLPERPYMRPAAKKNQKSGVKLMEAAVEHALTGKGRK